MSKARKWFGLLIVLMLMVVFVMELCGEQTSDKMKISIRKSEPQTVIYTIYRGSYEKIGQAIGKLYATAGQKGIRPQGHLSCVYLNNPGYVSSEHLLTEIRFPVSKDALKFAGTLGDMTDVKSLPAIEVAVAEKPMGQTNYSAVFNEINAWLIKQNYRTSDNACEKFLSGGMSGDYTQMKTEITVPIKKISDNKN
jgi:effector-binding domain-containing protein